MLTALVVTALLAGPVTGPVAVLPFKNLNDDASADYLRRGIAETIASDLRAGGKVTVVERESLDGAIREIGRAIAEEDAAIRAGKLVGAKVVVVGSFQQAGNKLRVNARFVEVETGVVLDAVKETGDVKDPFAVQDRIVEKLTGAKPAARKTTARTAKAYELYAKSLDAEGEEKKKLLAKAVEADAGFHYAADDLAALEGRVEGYREKGAELSAKRENAQLAKLRAEVFDPKGKLDDARTYKAISLLIDHASAERWRDLADDAKKIEAMGLPPFGVMEMAPHALAQRCWAHTMLGEADVALQLCEAYLKKYPDGPDAELVAHQIDLNADAKRAPN